MGDKKRTTDVFGPRDKQSQEALSGRLLLEFIWTEAHSEALELYIKTIDEQLASEISEESRQLAFIVRAHLYALRKTVGSPILYLVQTLPVKEDK